MRHRSAAFAIAFAIGLATCLVAGGSIAQEAPTPDAPPAEEAPAPPEEPPPPPPEEPPPPEAPKLWSWTVGLGFSLRNGTEDNIAVNFDGFVQKKWTQDTLGFRLIADYGEVNGDPNTYNASGELPWRHNFTERFFWTSTLFAGTDQIQNRDLRFIADTGPGYRIWLQNDKEFFDLGAAGGYRYDLFKPPQMPMRENLFDLRFFYRYQNKLGEYLEIIHGTDFSLPVNEVDAWFLTTEVTLLAPIYAGLAFRTNYRLEFNNQPAVGADGLNMWLTVGLQYEY